VQQTSEPTILAKQVDGILLVVHAGKTDRELVKKTVGILGKDKILGIVFNHSNETTKSYYHHYYQPGK
jgi:Mrp family chromosome partitioning ATPase